MDHLAKRLGHEAGAVAEEGSVRSVRRAFAILDCIIDHGERPLRLSQIARCTGLHKASAFRLLSTLEDIGAVRREGGGYRLGARISNLAAGHGSASEIQAAARLSLLRLADRFGDTFSLSIRSGLDVMCLDRQQGWYPIQAYALEIGGRRPLAVAAAGVALIARLPDEEIDEIVHSSLRRLERPGQVTFERLRGEVKTARERGFALIKEMIVPGMSGLGVPIHDPNGQVTAALSVATVTDRLSDDRRAELVPRMQAEVREVGEQLRRRARGLADGQDADRDDSDPVEGAGTTGGGT